jgi:oligoendopeptidase F
MESQSRKSLTLAAALAVSLIAIPVRSQNKFEPFPRDLAAKYHFDLARNFFPTPEAAETDRKAFYQALADFGQWRGKLSTSAENLYRAFQAFELLQAKTNLHLSYLYLRYSMDTRDTASRDAQQKLEADANRAMGFFSGEIVRLDESTITRFMKELPALKTYAYAIESSHRFQPYTLSPEQEEFLANAAPSMTNWQGELFYQLLNTTDFGVVHTPEGDLDLAKNRSKIINHPDPAVRAAGFKQNKAALATRRDLYAFALLKTIRARNQLARMRRFPDFPTETYFERFLTKKEVTQLLEDLANHAEINKRYERLRVERIKRDKGYSVVHFWDLTATLSDTPVPRFTIEEGTRLIKAVTAPLGPEYEREMAALLDPANGRLDIAPAPNRLNRWGGFSNAGPGRNSMFYTGAYEGYLEDLIILIHEAGHAVQSNLMNNSNVRPSYRNGPGYFTESFAGFNELLLADYLYRNTADKALKIYYLERFLEQAAEIFNGGRESLVEQQFYEEVEKGTVRTADDIEALTQKTGARFSIWFGPQSELPMEWTNANLYYAWPMYRLNYLYSKLLAIKYFDLYTRDPGRFVKSYQGLLRNGYDATPDVLLEKFIGTNTHDPKLVNDALEVFARKTDELKQLYGSAEQLQIKPGREQR